MSKKTFYQLFDSKLALFDALVERRIFDLPVALPDEDMDQEESLSQLLLGLAQALFSPERMAVVRLIVAEGEAAPDLKRTFDRLEMGRDLNLLESWLKRERDANRLAVEDIGEAARFVFGMSIAERLLRRLVGGDEKGEVSGLERAIRRSARIFLYSVASGQLSEASNRKKILANQESQD